jgi:hypothetical protein
LVISSKQGAVIALIAFWSFVQPFAAPSQMMFGAPAGELESPAPFAL